MSELPVATDQKSHAAAVPGWAAIIIGVYVVAFRLYLSFGVLSRLLEYASHTGGSRGFVPVVFVGLFSMGVVALGAVLIGGGIYLVKRQESGRMAVIVAGAILLAINLFRALTAVVPIILETQMVVHTNHGGTGETLTMGRSLLLAIVLGVLLKKVTSPAVKAAMLPKPAPDGG